MNRDFWSEWRIARLRSLWQAGVSVNTIAAALGAKGKNSIIGKAHRLKLPGRASPIKPSKAGPAAPAPAPWVYPRTGGLMPAMEASSPLPSSYGCQWPEGDEKPFRFCGAPRAPGRPYCAQHARRAYYRLGTPAAAEVEHQHD